MKHSERCICETAGRTFMGVIKKSNGISCGNPISHRPFNLLGVYRRAGTAVEGRRQERHCEGEIQRRPRLPRPAQENY